ncbi:hypothetical protein M8744_09510 [Lutimaribacter sp. EGI FJ00013]|uniref:Uncharacterized protein n=1 Tax=Lutimaribacter degradans TaxID=2945989 RepID=A0ACC5ZYE8_9RHOB|nr:hypothetical protein [Lutimaribacter sp. EGI FJ00013]MCM2562379.1 hypothetical protein [Lutimaribacter sp. EGI FJ00013]
MTKRAQISRKITPSARFCRSETALPCILLRGWKKEKSWHDRVRAALTKTTVELAPVCCPVENANAAITTNRGAAIIPKMAKMRVAAALAPYLQEHSQPRLPINNPAIGNILS